jgi:hypothetical protein
MSVYQPIAKHYADTGNYRFPFFESHSLFERLARNVHLSDRDFFATTMAACALAAGRMRDGGITHSNEQDLVLTDLPPKIFHEASENCLPSDITNITTLDALRAYPLLALSAIQGRQIDVMHKNIGLYFAILSIRRWHDESNWPVSWTATEREEMRKLVSLLQFALVSITYIVPNQYWSTYTLDVYSSIVWNGCIHFQEAHSRVQYPSNDTDIGVQYEDTSLPGWMVGWNFTTDLYRVLEHAVSRFRTQSSQFNILEMAAPSSPTFSSGLNARVNALYSALPEAFKTIKEMTGVPEKDIYGFQAANIQATLALLRMMLFSVEADSDVDKKCSVASDLLAVFHQIPNSYLRAISAPLIYHLSGIGQILGSVITSPISDASYSKVRELLCSMAALLESLESVLQRRAGAARSLLDQVDRIDNFMATQRQSQIDFRAFPQAHITTEEWSSIPINEEISPRYQLPMEIVGDWSWPLEFDDTSFAFFDWYDNA